MYGSYETELVRASPRESSEVLQTLSMATMALTCACRICRGEEYTVTKIGTEKEIEEQYFQQSPIDRSIDRSINQSINQSKGSLFNDTNTYGTAVIPVI